MKLNAEQIKRALECCHNRSCGVDCPYYEAEICTLEVMRDALALIKSQEQRIKELTVELDAMRGAANSYKMHNEKLTEDNERLRENNIFLNNTIGENAQQALEVTLEEIEKAKADALGEMQEKAEAFLTDEETDVIIAEGEVFIPISAIRKIAKEMLEDTNEN